MSLVDGVPCAFLPVSDRGLAYGDGLFETLRVSDGIVHHGERHLARLRAGADRLGIVAPCDAVWQEDLAKIIPPGGGRWVVKLILCRGEGGRGYAPAPNATSRRIVQIFDWPEWPTIYAAQGIETAVCATRLGTNPLLAGLKHLNRLEQVLASAELATAGLLEGLMLDQNDHLIEGTRSNVFVGLGGSLLTPQLDRCGVAGVMREIILEHAARAGIQVFERRLPLSQLCEATEMFFCNSLLGIWPVHTLRRPFVREFGVGPLTRHLQEQLTALELA